MRRNTVAINNVLKKKITKKILNQLNSKKKSTNIILKNKEIKQKKYMEKNRSNPQYLKKNYKAKILTRSIFKK